MLIKFLKPCRPVYLSAFSLSLTLYFSYMYTVRHVFPLEKQKRNVTSSKWLPRMISAFLWPPAHIRPITLHMSDGMVGRAAKAAVCVPGRGALVGLWVLGHLGG